MDALRGSVGLRLSNTFFSFFLVLKTRVVSYETCFGNHSNTAFFNMFIWFFNPVLHIVRFAFQGCVLVLSPLSPAHLLSL